MVKKKTWNSKQETLKTYKVTNPKISLAMAIRRELDENLAKSAELDAKILSARVSLNKTCPHPAIYIVKTVVKTFDGELWETENTYTCRLCDAEVRRETEIGS